MWSICVCRRFQGNERCPVYRWCNVMSQLVTLFWSCLSGAIAMKLFDFPNFVNCWCNEKPGVHILSMNCLVLLTLGVFMLVPTPLKPVDSSLWNEDTSLIGTHLQVPFPFRLVHSALWNECTCTSSLIGTHLQVPFPLKPIHSVIHMYLSNRDTSSSPNSLFSAQLNTTNGNTVDNHLCDEKSVLISEVSWFLGCNVHKQSV